jgi:threonine/homoserine/homoserine lactone efflux protein
MMAPDVALVMKGAAVGFSVSAPLGPVGVLCISRVLGRGFGAGVAVGLGAATADCIYAVLAAFGLSATAETLVPLQPLLRLLAVGFLFYLALRTFRSVAGGRDPLSVALPSDSSAIGWDSRWGGYVTGFLLLITNPAAIVIFWTVFAGLGLVGAAADSAGAVAVVIGVVTGAATWWLILAGASWSLRSRVRGRGLRWINVGSGVLLVAFAVIVLAGVWT